MQFNLLKTVTIKLTVISRNKCEIFRGFSHYAFGVISIHESTFSSQCIQQHNMSKYFKPYCKEL